MSNELRVAFNSGFKKEAGSEHMQKNAILGGLFNFASKIPKAFSGMRSLSGLSDDAARSLASTGNISKSNVGSILGGTDDFASQIGSASKGAPSVGKIPAGGQGMNPSPAIGQFDNFAPFKNATDDFSSILGKSSTPGPGVEELANMRTMNTQTPNLQSWTQGVPNTGSSLFGNPLPESFGDIAEGFGNLSQNQQMGVIGGGGFLGGMGANEMFSGDGSGGQRPTYSQRLRR